ncbi:MAG: SRPBCC family protein, partial [Verrucomicrobia bacterium]|nr:SRPBCC family protein [Verrucomicrobiota bacterium]
PLRVVYNQWTQYEQFPEFMEGVEEVRQEGDKRLFWRARIGGKEKCWEAEIVKQVPDERIAWRSVMGAGNPGEVTFDELDATRTLVILTMDYEPEGPLEKAGDALGLPSERVEGDLKRFRHYIESPGKETGGWRGEINEQTRLEKTEGMTPGHLEQSPVESAMSNISGEEETDRKRTGLTSLVPEPDSPTSGTPSTDGNINA